MPDFLFAPLPLFIVLLSVVSIGVGKGGMAGVGTAALPLLAMVYPPVEAAAILVPLLISQDLVGVWLYRRSWNRTIIWWMLPPALVGTGVAVLLAALVRPELVLVMLGVISIMFAVWRLWLIVRKLPEKPLSPHNWPGAIFGFLSGFTSQIALAGAPPFQIWVIPKKLPHLEMVGTTAVFFAILNWAKIPAFIALGAFSRESLTLSLLLLPVATAATWLGAWMVRRISGQGFYAFVNVMLAAIGVKLIWDAFSA